MINSKRANILLQGVIKDSLFDLLKKRKIKDAVVLEGRPSLEAVKSNSKQLLKRNIVATVITDNMAGFFFYKNLVKEVWLSYQARDKDYVLCDIGALILGILGKRHKVPIMCYPAAKKNKYLGKAQDLINFNGNKIVHLSVQGYVPLLEWVPLKYIRKVYE